MERDTEGFGGSSTDDVSRVHFDVPGATLCLGYIVARARLRFIRKVSRAKAGYLCHHADLSTVGVGDYHAHSDVECFVLAVLGPQVGTVGTTKLHALILLCGYTTRRHR